MDTVQESFVRDGYVIIDNFLYTDVIDELYESAVNCDYIDDDYSKWGYHSINFGMEKGFPFTVLPDVINAIHGAFSPLHPLEFDRGWAFVYNNEAVGVTPHADPASINVNLWVTPNNYIKDPTKNGLIIYDKKPPEDWTWMEYNSDETRVREYLKEVNATPRFIPYNYNRIILFDSKYFHKTNGVSTVDGRRVNYTFMFK
tara:strand:+ start:499 stop:1098 length:600 start_codon:yes stop_codon:yes gene_type:complete